VTGVVLRLAGPLQSWGEHSTFTERDTLAFPTRSGIIGMFAAAEGISRGQPLNRYDPIVLTVRIDREGQLLQDFHTTGGGLPRDRTVPTASGGRRPAGAGTVVTRRWYLSGAVFTAAAEGPQPLIEEITRALRAPHWQPYLGRRSCPPDQPLLLRASPDPVTDLREAVPLPRRWADADYVPVRLITEQPIQDAPVTEVSDVPDINGRHERRYRTRAVHETTIRVPAVLAAWRNAAEYQRALHDYARRTS
jgi:CRISPR system Cascade subunit CasD